MKKIFIFSLTIILIFQLTSAGKLFAQSYPSGIYFNVTNKSNKITFYSTNGIHYIKQEKSISDIDEKDQREHTYGMRRSGQILNYTSGPFASYGLDGYFYRRNGKDYYFDKLQSEYEGNFSNPKDSLRFLYIKASELLANWELTPEARIGELGVINDKVLYEIVKVSDVYKTTLNGNSVCIYIKGSKSSEEEIGTYLISENDYLRLNISKMGYDDIQKLKGKILQLYFRWQSGSLPGYINEDSADLESNKNSIPFEIQILDKSFSSKSVIQFPIPKN